MNNQYKIILRRLIYFSLLLFSTAHAVCSVRDDAGNIVKLNHPATRLISLAPDITETLFAIGAGPQVLAVIRGSDYPASAQSLPRIGSYASIDIEKIVSLKPDLIITWDRMFARDLAILQKMGVPVYVNKPVRVEDVPRSMRNFGCLTGRQASADKAAQQFVLQLMSLRKHYQSLRTVNVFYQIGPYSLMTVSRQSWINQAIEVCGGKNIFAYAPAIAAEVSMESVITAQPEVIIAASADDNWQQVWQAFPSLIAVRERLLFTIPPDLINRAGPRLITGIATICSNIDLSRQKIAYLAGNRR